MADKKKPLADFEEYLKLKRNLRINKPVNKTSVITVLTDGVAREVPYGFSSWAWYVNDDSWDYGAVMGGNNPSAEGLAIFQALTTLPLDAPLIMVSHSKTWVSILGSRGTNGWIHDWAEHGWIKQNGRQPANLPIVKALYKAIEQREAPQGFKWIKERRGSVAASESVTRLAGRACELVGEGLFVPAGPGWTGPGSDTADISKRRPPPPPLKSRTRTMERF